MPLYEIECRKCGKRSDVVRSIAERDNLPECCGEKMFRAIATPAIQPDNVCYRSMVTGEMITSRTAHKNHLKEHKLIEVGNEKPKPRNTEISKAEKWALRKEIAQRLDHARR